MKFEQTTIASLLNKRNKYNDHVGIEIETEGTSLPNINNDYWRSEADGSLRGESFEYVLKVPMHYPDVPLALNNMSECLKAAGSKVKDSPNAGVHVHINVGDLTVTQLFNFVALYLIVEDLLVDKCGTHRIGNLFCLRISDAEYLIDHMVKVIRAADLKLLLTDEIRYASINLKAVAEYGSLEFRAWRSDGDLEAIQWWVDLLMSLKHKAKQIDNPTQIVAEVSLKEPRGFFHDILGNFIKDIPWEDRFKQSIIDNTRRVQLFAYEGDW